MTKEGSTKIVNFMTPRAGVLMWGCGNISHYSEYVLSSNLSIYNTLIDCYCVKGLWCCFLNNTIIHLLYDGAVNIQIRALLTRCQCKVSVTQVTIKARGPLVSLKLFKSASNWLKYLLILYLLFTCAKMAEEGLGCIFLEHSLGNPFSDWYTNMNIQKAVNCLHSACWLKKWY